MPPILPFLPLIGDAIGAASLGLGIDKAVQGTPKPPPITTIPGSPLTTVGGAEGPAAGLKTGGVGLPQSSVLSQVLGTGGSGSTGAGAGIASAGSTHGGGGGSVAPPLSIGGGTGAAGNPAPTDGLLPWMQGLTNNVPAIASPGGPGGI